MSDNSPSRANRPVLALHVPEPAYRPGDTPDFSSVAVPAAGAAPRPDPACEAEETHPLCTHLVRVLGDDDRAIGAWDPRLTPDVLRKMLTRHEDRARRSTTACIAPSGRARPVST